MKASLLVVVILLVVAPVVSASPLEQEDPVAGVDAQLIEYFAALGLGFLVPFAIEVFKRFKIVPDGMASGVAVVLNALLYFALLLLGAFEIDLEGEHAQSIIEILASLSKLLLMVMTTFTSFGKMREMEIPFFQKRER